jgi:hypothetical protein
MWRLQSLLITLREREIETEGREKGRGGKKIAPEVVNSFVNSLVSQDYIQSM